MFNSLTLNHPDDFDELDACNSLPSFRQEPSDDGTSKMREGDFPGREREKIDRTHARLAVTRRARVLPKRNPTQRNLRCIRSLSNSCAEEASKIARYAFVTSERDRARRVKSSFPSSTQIPKRRRRPSSATELISTRVLT